jgi:hypothetical protein
MAARPKFIHKAIQSRTPARRGMAARGVSDPGDNNELSEAVRSFAHHPRRNDRRGHLYTGLHLGSSCCILRGQRGSPVFARRSAVDLSNEREFTMKKLNTLLLVLGLLPMLGCSPLENQARDTAAALSGAIVAAQTKYQASCTANSVQEICGIINRGVSGENALVTAVESYCGWTPTLAPPDPKATCIPVKSAQAALQAAIANAATLTSQIKGVI